VTCKKGAHWLPMIVIDLVHVSAEECFHTPPTSMAEWKERRLEYLASQQK